MRHCQHPKWDLKKNKYKRSQQTGSEMPRKCMWAMIDRKKRERQAESDISKYQLTRIYSNMFWAQITSGLWAYQNRHHGKRNAIEDGRGVVMRLGNLQEQDGAGWQRTRIVGIFWERTLFTGGHKPGWWLQWKCGNSVLIMCHWSRQQSEASIRQLQWKLLHCGVGWKFGVLKQTVESKLNTMEAVKKSPA